MHYYVNLPISWIYEAEKWLSFFVQRGMNPELGIDEKSLVLPMRWHKENAARIKDSGLFCAVHLPFFAPPLGSSDAKKRREGLEVLKKAAEIASVYEAGHMIGHPSFFAHIDSDGKETDDKSIGPAPSAAWLESSFAGWEELMSVSNAPLYLENTHDIGPEAVLALLDALAQGAYPQQAAMCFDVGHWFSFAQGCDRRNLPDWIKRIARHLKHLHLHDNNGRSDQHLGLGQGKIPLHKFFSLLLEAELYPSFTLEPHDEDSLRHSLGWLENDELTVKWLNSRALTINA